MVGRGELTERRGRASSRCCRRAVARWPMAGPSHGHQWDLMEAAHGSALAGPARALRAVADVRRPALSLATRRHLGPAARPCADPIGCGGRGGVGGQHRQFHRPRPSPCEWRASSAQSSRRKKGISHPSDEGLGRSRGGLTTKFHLACDGRGRPLAIVITPGHRHDSTQLQTVLDGIRVPRAAGRGRPRTRPDRLIADKGYSYGRCRQLAPPATDSPHYSPTTRPARATSGSARATAPLRSHDLCASQRRRALHQSAQTVAWAGDPLRETRRQLPGDGGARLHRPVAGVLIRQPGSRPKTEA